MTTIILPYPPATNNLFINRGKGRAKSPRYRAWIQEAALQLKGQNINKVLGKVTIEIEASPPDKRLRDIDNLIKPALDLLVSQGVIEDDDMRYVQAVSAKWVYLDNSFCKVRICHA